MVDRVTETVDKLASAPQAFDDISVSGNEYYFKVKRHTFSIACGSSSYYFFVYPNWTKSTSELSNLFQDYDTANPPTAFVQYDGDDYDEDSFRQLFEAVRSKHLGIDKIFDDILK